MKVFIYGATGLLGCEAANIFLEKGCEVVGCALPPNPVGAPIPEAMDLHLINLNNETDETVEKLFTGCDVFVYAAGVDERKECIVEEGSKFKCSYDMYDAFNNQPLVRLLPICKKVGMKRAVVLGSYFSYLSKIALGKAEPFEPITKKQIKGLKGILERNSYLKARMDQEAIVESFADETFDTTVLELPYIFGTQPGRKPVWTVLIEQINMMDNWPFTMYPKGGTAMLTVHQVGQTIVGAALQETGKGFQALPIGMYNLDWDSFLQIVYDARGMYRDKNGNFKGRKVVGVAPWMMRMGLGHVKKDYKKRHVDSGMDPDQLPNIMDYKLYTDPQIPKDLGVEEDDIRAAIFDSIAVSVASYEGKVQLLEMKGE